MFAVALANPTPPTVVGELIRDIVDGDSWRLRYPAGPDAAPMMEGRAHTTDEEVIAHAAESDEAFLARFEQATGVRLKL